MRCETPTVMSSRESPVSSLRCRATDEAIEVAGPAGTDLTGWSLVLYNGDTATAATRYRTLALSGSLPDQSSGYGTAFVAAPGLQNGDRDGFALVDAAGTVVQLLSYEGVFTAADGPAAGRSSTDIGIAQSGAPVGSSLQLTGTGRGPAKESLHAFTPEKVEAGRLAPSVQASCHRPAPRAGGPRSLSRRQRGPACRRCG